MNRQNLRQNLEVHLAKLRAESEDAKRQHDDIGKRLKTVETVAALDELSIEESKIKAHEDILTGKIRQTNAFIQELELEERKSADSAERERILTLAKKIVAKGSRCSECGEAGEACPGLPVPQFFNAGFVGKISAKDWWVDLQCKNIECGNRWRIWPDKEGNGL